MNSGNLFTAKCVIVGDGAVGKVIFNEVDCDMLLNFLYVHCRLVCSILMQRVNSRKATFLP